MFSCSPARLEDRVALVQQDISFTDDMSVRQTLLFHSFLREPGTLTRGRDTKGRINALIEDLGLSQVIESCIHCKKRLSIFPSPAGMSL
jgi:ABC-type multidrug transport system ATPase subunit